MTTTATTRTINCTIQGVTTKSGRNGDYLVLEVLRPKMKFPEKYNAWEPSAFEGVKSGDSIALTLERERVKDDKQDDGQVGSYWWTAIAPFGTTQEPDPEELFGDPRAQEPHLAPIVIPDPEEAKWDAINAVKDQKILRGQAFNAAVSIIAALPPEEMPGLDDESLIMGLRTLRDRLYHDVLTVPIAPPHWCYEHETARNKGNTGYGHRVDGGWCIEGQGVVLEGE